MTNVGALYHRLQNSESFSRLGILRSLDNAWRLTERNYLELQEILSFAHDPPQVQQLLPLYRRPELHLLLNEVTRLLVNYVGSAIMFADFCRRTERRSASLNRSVNGFSEKISELFRSNSLVQFVNKFRNYCIHYDLPNTAISVKWHQQSGWTTGIHLKKEDLESWNEWNKLSKAFLDAAEAEIPLKEILEEYHSLQTDFTTWFKSALGRAYSEEIQFVEVIQEEIKYEESKQYPQELRQAIGKYQGNEPETLFYNLTTDLPSLRQILETNEAPQVRLNKAIEHLESHGHSLPEDIIQELYKIFRTHYGAEFDTKA